MGAALNQLGVVHRKVARADPEAVAVLAKCSVATIHEAQGRTGLMRPHIRPAWRNARMCGAAVTVLLQPDDNWMLHVAAEQIQPGDVVVAACVTDSLAGFFGELLATSYAAHGAGGLVIEGGVRDVDALEAMKFPVFSRAISARGTVKNTLGSVNIPVVCGGVTVSPGDVVVADTDGIVVVPARVAAGVAQKAKVRDDNEAAKRKIFADGALGLDYYKMRERLETAGLRYED